MGVNVNVVAVTQGEFFGCELIGSWDTLGEAVGELRQCWNEEQGPQGFLVLGDCGEPLAWLVRDCTDPEVCHTSYDDGRTESHRCTYLTDLAGHYLDTAVVPLGLCCWCDRPATCWFDGSKYSAACHKHAERWAPVPLGWRRGGA